MTIDHEMAVAMATEIGKQVPVKQVYEDAGSPAARQIGATFEDVVKCIRLVGFPIQWLAVQQDRYRAFIERSKEAVPEENRILPSPQILGPVLEGIKYQIEDTEISEAFRRLLSRAMDKSRVGEAHPAFLAVIPRLSPDEARLLVRISASDIVTEGEVQYGTVTFVGPADFDIGVVQHPDLVVLYISNLASMGLIKFWSDNLDSERQAEIFREQEFGSPAWAKRHIGKLYLSMTPFGSAFVRSCLQDP